MELIPIPEIKKILALLERTQEACKYKKEHPDKYEDRLLYSGKVEAYNDAILLIKNYILNLEPITL
ncbi:hypothetical protein EKK58_11560 [Candidatus Dependentiae bacterium]|nr:MAG: hypothetical protein EKK58_11560 [Candidatus Dependentiae bacterium]